MTHAFDPTTNLLSLLKLVQTGPPDWDGAARRIGQQATLVTFINPLSLATVRRRPVFLDELAAFDLVYPDSILVARLTAATRGVCVPRRSLDGNSLAPEFLACCTARGLRLALVGGREGVAAEAGRVLVGTFGVDLVLSSSGYFADQSSRMELLQCLEEQADVVLCGMGSGTQERFLLDLTSLGWRGIGVTCGGYFDQAALAGVRYYPQLVERLHLRAAWRMLHEPVRLVPRYTIEYMPFYRGMVALTTGRHSPRRVPVI